MSFQLKFNDGMDVFEPTHYKCAGTGKPPFETIFRLTSMNSVKQHHNHKLFHNKSYLIIHFAHKNYIFITPIVIFIV